MSTSGSDYEDEEPTISSDAVVTKYKMAADIVNATLKKIIEKCVVGGKVGEICAFGDSILATDFANVFKKNKDILKGIAFPTCISVNNCICHYSPLPSQEDYTLVAEDVLKIELGGHIDGFPAQVAHTIVVGADKEHPITGRRADVMLAAHNCVEAALRMIRPGNKDERFAEISQKITASFDCTPVEGITSFSQHQHEIEGDKYIIMNPSEGQRKDHRRTEFELHDVFAVDCLISSGNGKARREDVRTNVFRHREGLNYQLKMKASRQFFAEVEKKYGNMAFSLRSFEDEKKARVGVLESVKHDLLLPYDVLYESRGEFVAQFKFTVLLMNNGPMRITGLPFDTTLCQSDKHIEDEELKTLLAQPVSLKTVAKKNKKNKKKAAAAAAGQEAKTAAA